MRLLPSSPLPEVPKRRPLFLECDFGEGRSSWVAVENPGKPDGNPLIGLSLTVCQLNEGLILDAINGKKAREKAEQKAKQKAKRR